MARVRNLQIILVVGDILALLLFVLIGQADHQTVSAENPLSGLLLAGAPFVVAWLVTAFVVGAYCADVFTPRVMLSRSLTAWLIALPIGIVLRALLLGRAVIPTAFILVAFAFGGLFVIGWRMMFVFLLQWRKRAQPE
jgi:hypothetical protein